MNFLQKLLGAFSAGSTAGADSGWLGWFNSASKGWSSSGNLTTPATGHDTSPTPAPNASTPAEKTPAAAPPAVQSDTGIALGILLDALAKK